MTHNIFILICLSFSNIANVRSFEKENLDPSSFEAQIKILENKFNEKINLMEIRMKIRMEQQENIIQELKQETAELNKIIENKVPEVSAEVLKSPSIEDRVVHLEEVAKVKILRTCEELERHGVSLSGYYDLDPDGELVGQPPIRAYCDMENHVTEIIHDANNQSITIDHCQTDHCFTKSFTYTASMQQMRALIDLSSHCDQMIEFDCFLTPLRWNGMDLGVWTDQYGEDQVYYYGENYNNHVCSCSITGNCTGQTAFDNKCNCDSPDNAEWMEDTGRITNKTALPITAFKYGPLLYEMQEARVRVGRLRCGGRVEVEMPVSSCGDLKRMGETREGLYALNDAGNNNYPKMSYCEMNKPGFGDDLETESHWMKWSSGSGEIVFAVQKTGSNDIPQNAYVVFDKEVINVGASMNATSGVFKAKVAGKFQFSLSGLGVSGTGYVCIDIFLNGNLHLRWYDANTSYYNGISRVWLMDLKIGDTLRLQKCYKGGLHGTVHALEFNGYLM